MPQSELLMSVRGCLQAALKLSDAETVAIGPDTTAAELRGWTSMAHLELVLALENRFGVTFGADEIAELASVPAILAALSRERTH